MKTCLKLNRCFRLTTIWYTWNYPSWGGADQAHTPKKWNSKIWPSTLSDKCNLILWWKLSIPVKIWARSNPFKGCLELNCQFMVPSLHALPIHVFWAWYAFLNEYTTYFSLSGCPLSPKIWFTALLLPYWSKYEQTLRHPPEGELQACWGPYTTPVITAILDVILKPMQSDLVGYRLFPGQISGL